VARNILISFGFVIAAAALCAGICRALGCDPHLTDLTLAAGVCLLESIAGLAPISFAGGASLAGTFQAALVGSVLHMVSALIFAFVAVMGLRRGNAFVYWMLAFYMLTLGELVVIFVTHMRAKERSGRASI
jgi:hypothetical protein